MTGKSSWVPSRTQGLFSQCCRWHCVSWLLQELLLSRCGWGVSLGQASLVIPIFAFVDRDLAWHCINYVGNFIFKLICFRFIYQTWFVITFIRTLMMKSICELYVICGMYVESCTILVVVNRLSRPVVVLDGLPGLYGFKYDSATACGLPLYLYSYKLVGSATAGIRARFNVNCHKCI
jgi:hypothetical protein